MKRIDPSTLDLKDKVVTINRVSKTVKGGRTMRFSAMSAVLIGDKSGITMEMYTDQCGVQVYTGNVIEENRVCKDGAVYTKHSGICLETQAFPNGLKFSHFPCGILKKGETYDTFTEYKFI